MLRLRPGPRGPDWGPQPHPFPEMAWHCEHQPGPDSWCSPSSSTHLPGDLTSAHVLVCCRAGDGPLAKP